MRTAATPKHTTAEGVTSTSAVGFDQRLPFGPYDYHLRLGGTAELTGKLGRLDLDRCVVVADAQAVDANPDLTEATLAAIAAAAPVGVLLLGQPNQATSRRITAAITRSHPGWIQTFPPVTEPTKTGELALQLAAAAIRGSSDRRRDGVTHQSALLTLGGGLVGNLGGLAAAWCVRGIRLIHLPTTLAAISDSCVSNKQAASIPELGKNLIGTYHAPTMVWAELGWLDTLPAREVSSALCELAKNVLAICPEQLSDVLALVRPAGTDTPQQYHAYTPQEYQRIISWCINAKLTVMRHDHHERRAGLVLEYGHTVGHALETLTCGQLAHGHAVAIGMTVAAHIANRHLEIGLPDSAVDAHYELLARVGVAIGLPAEVTPEAVVAAVAYDNKRGYLPVRDGHAVMVLLRALGVPACTDEGLPLTQVTEADLLAGLRVALSAPTRVA